MEASFDIRANAGKNRLYVILKGFFSDELAQQASDVIAVELRRLLPGFNVITDISTLKPATPFGLELIQRGQKAIAEKGAKRIIRIVDRSHITGQLQFIRTGKQVYDAQEFTTAVTLEEAEAMLDQA